jgi:GntR family transcriptional regulator/MocR family aminotransferase
MFSEQSTSKEDVDTQRERRAPKYFRLVTAEEGGAPIHEQLYQRVRELIISGALQHGARLAPSRSLAASLGVSRNSVLTALDRLTADGFLEARKGSGVYIAYRGAHSAPQSVPGAEYSPKEPLPFALGVPPTDIFPARLWERLQARIWKRLSPLTLHEDDAVGWLGLRQAIATHVAMTRGLQCSPAQVVVVSCIAAGLDLAVRSLDLVGKSVWMEDPGYNAAASALQYAGVRVVPVGVDQFGIDVEAGRRAASNAKGVFVTPACQFPNNVAMSKSRRSELLAWAEEFDGWILEDDFGAQSADPAHRPPALAATPGSRVIYFNTFNQVLFPALRVAYLILPAALVTRFAAVQKGLSGSANIPNQMVLADFIAQGHLDAHIKQLLSARELRRAALVHALEARLSEHLSFGDARSGYHIVCSPKRVTIEQVLAGCRMQNLVVEPLAKYILGANRSQQLLLGYLGFTPTAIADAAERLCAVLDSIERTPL